MKKTKFINVTWKEGKYYIAQCLNVDVSSFGKTRKEALKNLEEALELYLEDISKPKISKVEQPSITIQQLRYA
jgi:predicted RNase H-like HicB family nuclease